MLPLLLALALPACRPAPSPYASYEGEPITLLRPDSTLFATADGRIIIRLPCIEVRDEKCTNPYMFVSTIECGKLEHCLLAQILDVPTFRRVPGTTNYWMDKRALYTNPYYSMPGQQFFFELGLVERVRFAADPDTAFVGNQGFYRGIPLEWERGEM
jgi:hypothetical protein